MDKLPDSRSIFNLFAMGVFSESQFRVSTANQLNKTQYSF